MKKLTFTLMAALALCAMGKTEAAVSASPSQLSLQHYEVLATTLGSHPDFQNIISDGEFIVDMRIQRRSINVTEGNVYVTLTTRRPIKDNVIVYEKDKTDTSPRHGCRRDRELQKYVATLSLVTSDKGSPTITVVNIAPTEYVRKHHGCKKGKKTENVSHEAVSGSTP